MSLGIFFAALAVLYVAMFIVCLRGQKTPAVWLVMLLLIGLCYDNCVLALSGQAFAADWYYGASWLRYLLHVFVLPPLVLAALWLSQGAGVAWAQTRVAALIGATFVVAAVTFGLVTEVAGLELVPEVLADHTRYVSAHASPPFATIATNLVLLIVTAALWRRSGWPWLFAATLTIFIANGATAGSEWGLVVGNSAELLFAAAWVLTARRFGHIDNNHLRPD